MRNLSAAAAIVLAMTLLVGCGADSADDDPPATTPTLTDNPDSSNTDSPHTESPHTGSSGPTEPLCSDVWVDGEVLVKPYAGCYDADSDSWVDADVTHCSSGQRIVTFADSFYAVPGREVVGVAGPLAADPDYTQMVASCTA